MRKTYRKNDFRELNRQIIIIGLLFMMSIVIGSYINKILPGSSDNILNNINPAVEYYNLNINVKDTVLQNLKSDTIFMGSIALLSLFVVTIPAVLVIFVLKGMSIGYTINSFILALKLKSAKMILIILFKNLVIIPCAIILTLISLSYFKEMVYEFKKKNRRNMQFLIKRYILNIIIIIALSLGLQLILNTVSIGIIKFLVK
ncbi:MULTISPECIES: stage II sporulation protein M [unclassified Clostridioides]|uniref:stage II sporulation protein M n=1 Tax=unclassified Clostridioides TaxID=2635829 RepID=UPI001D10D68D|nr:stage II sporulation protein M [Clostridioides sp. ZZV14-6150]MCC0659768.1 stage II sporulation protein M [Clostridioides sp. ZZV14-6154]MCC0666717.1 stage II sporulation protein M [Clostridioides sp. ZZV14-6153]MCC0717739.1 stage II sporulation protein M [Clostridioides sp. ZZV14-6105]MCC0722692.1 stage II sporulation protein M [Clostridioides sp. ZZV14-6104]MCC0725434.1 stage II sporulation protein M [Clostridioides sp. ZZV14-6045]MCC0729179.1 stage II sporulation protein M [Clostridioid